MIQLDLHADVVTLTEQLCNVASVSGDEQRLADAIEHALAACNHLVVIRSGNTVVARTQLGRARRVILAGHIDTVPINANVPVERRTVNGQELLWGRGTVDMKGGVAVLLKLAATITEPNVDVTYMFYDNEEVAAELNGLKRLADEHPQLFHADLAILGEPSNAGIEGGCNGNLRVNLTFTGKRAHSARNWMGVNAIEKAAATLQLVRDYQAETIEVDGLDYRESLSVVGIAGGVAGNVIPDECVVQVNYRFAPSRSASEAEVLLRELFVDADAFTVDDAVDGARPGLNTDVVRELIAVMQVTPKPKYGWTDVARFSALGVPAINLGPGDPSLAHADDEQVPVAQILTVFEGLSAWLTPSA